MLSREIKGIKGRETTGEDYWTGRHRNEKSKWNTEKQNNLKNTHTQRSPRNFWTILSVQDMLM